MELALPTPSSHAVGIRGYVNGCIRDVRSVYRVLRTDIGHLSTAEFGGTCPCGVLGAGDGGECDSLVDMPCDDTKPCGWGLALPDVDELDAGHRFCDENGCGQYRKASKMDAFEKQ